MTKKLLLNVTPDQLVVYGKKRVGFYDVELYKGEEKSYVETLYLYVEHMEDNKTVVRRAAGKKKIRGTYGELMEHDEKELYKRAYDKYLAAKANIKPDFKDKEIERLKAQLEDKKDEPVEKKGSEKTIKEIKEELDNLGCDYNVNDTKGKLLELLYAATNDAS